MPVRISSAAREQATERLANNPGPTTFSMAESEVSCFGNDTAASWFTMSYPLWTDARYSRDCLFTVSVSSPPECFAHRPAKGIH